VERKVRISTESKEINYLGITTADDNASSRFVAHSLTSAAGAGAAAAADPLGNMSALIPFFLKAYSKALALLSTTDCASAFISDNCVFRDKAARG
jgi:hypothetical protein